MPSKKKRYTFSYQGKQHSVFADSDIEAGRRIAEKKAELESSVPTSAMKLKDFYDGIVETQTINQSRATAKTTEYIARHYILDEIGTMKIQDIKAHHLQRILNSHKGMSNTTIKGIYAGIRYMFRKALEYELIDKDPSEFLIKPKGSSKTRRALTEEERKAVIEVAKTKRMYYGYLLMILCGCRPTEAWECKGSDVVVREGQPLLHIRGTKTKASDRFVPINEELYRILKKIDVSNYISLTDQGNKIGGNANRRWKHFTYHVNRYMGAKTYRNQLLEYPFGQDLSPYNLRHEYCTDLARHGVDIRIAQKLMGHSTMRMTADIYTDLESLDILNAPCYVPNL